MNNIQKIQKDLQNGMSINDACRKYNISFKVLCNIMPRSHPKQKKEPPKVESRTLEPKITQRKDSYYVRHGRDMYGTYSSLEDAIRMRDYCEKHGWSKNQLDNYCRILGITRRTR